jgi:hypothetical protein
VHFFFEKFCGFGNLFYICVVKANGKFAERFFEDMVNKHLSVVTSCDYGGEIETSLYYDETVVTSSSDTVVNHHNGLEE